MIQKPQGKKTIFPFFQKALINEFNENNTFLEAKNEALSPLNDQQDEELVEDLQRTKNLDIKESTVLILSRRMIFDLDNPENMEIYEYVNNYIIHHV